MISPRRPSREFSETRDAMKRILSFLLLAAATLTAGRAAAQTYAEKVQRYIATYKDLAMQEQQRSGIPASITLAQGILESGAGESELATAAANHFGIKCKSSWMGETYNHDDDAPDECFRKYATAEASYRDHSDYLKTAGRYKPCFAQSTTDYAAWAYQLKSCGYATSPTYAQRLIRIIEDYKLQQYTYAALDSQDPVRVAQAGEVVPENDAPAPIAAEPMRVGEKPGTSAAATAETSRMEVHSETPGEARARETQVQQALATNDAVAADGTTTKDGRRGFYAKKGDVLLEDAIRHRIRYAKLLEINSLPDEPLSADRFIYLEKATSTRIEHDVAAMAGHDETARLASATSARAEAVPAAAMVASTAGMVPEPARKAADIPAAAAESARDESQSSVPEKPLAAPVVDAAVESTQDAVVPTATEEIAYNAEPATATEQASATNSERVSEPASAPQEVAATTSQPVEIISPATSNERTAVAPVAINESAATAVTNDGFNIASESAVEEAGNDEDDRTEQLPVVAAAPEEEPKDEMSRLKARFDKAVYAPTKPRPVQQSAPVSGNAAPVKAAPVAASSPSGAKFYTVQKGDTAFGIAKKHGITVRQLQEWNGLSMDAGVPLGKKLKVQP